jgi:hypothetical protein
VFEPLAEAALDAVAGIVWLLLDAIAETPTPARRVRLALHAFAEAPNMALGRRAWPAPHSLVETMLDLVRGGYMFTFLVHVLRSARSPAQAAG